MKAYCLLNHNLTDNQLNELNEVYKCNEVIYPGTELSKKWAQIPAEKELDMNIIKDVMTWLKDSQKEDVLIVQGEFGSTFMLVDYALKKGLRPVHAVTKRVASESRNGEVVNRQYVFEHVCFRLYSCYMEL